MTIVPIEDIRKRKNKPVYKMYKIVIKKKLYRISECNAITRLDACFDSDGKLFHIQHIDTELQLLIEVY